MNNSKFQNLQISYNFKWSELYQSGQNYIFDLILTTFENWKNDSFIVYLT